MSSPEIKLQVFLNSDFVNSTPK